ncbi:MAG: hypothetical protein AB1298_06370 [Bacteroidota bacterium]
MAAANNLRLSSEKIETVAIIRQRFNDTENLTEEIKKIKKITELSKLGIKLGELQNFIESGKFDFLKLSDKFKEHSYGLVRELNAVLDILTPQAARKVFQKIDENSPDIDLTSRPHKTQKESSAVTIQVPKEIELPKRSRADELREAIIFEELNKESGFNFENFEEKVLRPIKELDLFLNRVMKYDFTESEINNHIKTMNENAGFAQKVGFEILSNMHAIFARGLELINQKKIAASSNVVESLRACLIVIVAVVRGKEVDITNYLNRAENFGKTIIKQRER